MWVAQYVCMWVAQYVCMYVGSTVCMYVFEQVCALFQPTIIKTYIIKKRHNIKYYNATKSDRDIT